MLEELMEREGWSWYLTSMCRLLTDEQGRPRLVMGMAVPLHSKNHFAATVQRLIDENQFLRQHRVAFSSLTPRERDVLRLLALGVFSPRTS